MIMNHEEFLSVYNKALETDSFKVHNDFLNILLADHSVTGMERHFAYFNECDNSDLKRILGNGFLKRGDEGLSFLLKKLNSETDNLIRSNIIHIIGLTHDRKYLPSIIPFLKNEDQEVRYKAIVVCGWLGDTETINILKVHYQSEQVDILRGFTISAMRQIFFRHKETKDEIVKFIYTKLPKEIDEEVIAIMIVVLQDLTKIKYGLKEDPYSGEVSGNILKAKCKILKTPIVLFQ